MTITPDEWNALDVRLTKIASVGGSLLSNASAARKALDAINPANQPPPVVDPPPVDPGPWTVAHTFDLTKDEGWSYTTGVRNTDQSYNQKSQATFGADGLTITAERPSATSKIVSADMWATFAPVDGDWAAEADITMTGLGSGMFPAWWFGRGGAATSELDAFEYTGAHVGAKYEMKSNLIKTGPSGGTYFAGQVIFDIPKATLGNFEGKHTWRVEKVGDAITLFCDGAQIGQHTKAGFDKACGAGSWDAQVAATGVKWFPRFTFQVGNGTGSTSAGVIPDTWRSSTMLVSRLITFLPTK